MQKPAWKSHKQLGKKPGSYGERERKYLWDFYYYYYLRDYSKILMVYFKQCACVTLQYGEELK